MSGLARDTTTRAGICTPSLVAKAIELIEADGLPALSMRRLADAFDITPPSLYWYVPSKDCLLDLVADELTKKAADFLITRRWPCRTAVLQLTHLAYLYRGFLCAHPQSALLIATRLVAGPNRVHLIEAFVGDLITRHDVPADAAFAAAAAVRAFTHGYVIEQNARRSVIGQQSGRTVEATQAEFQSTMAATRQTSGDRQLTGTPGYDLQAEQADLDLTLQPIARALLGRHADTSDSGSGAAADKPEPSVAGSGAPA